MSENLKILLLVLAFTLLIIIYFITVPVNKSANSPERCRHFFHRHCRYRNGRCRWCGKIDPNHEHVYVNSKCTICSIIDPDHEHIYDENCICRICQKNAHSYSDGKCRRCGKIDPNHEHIYINGRCRICREINPDHEHIYHNLYCLICYKRLDCDAIERQLNKKKDDYLGVLRYADNKAVKAELDIIRTELDKLNNLKRDPNYECTYENGYCTICRAAFDCQAVDRKIKELWQNKSRVLYWRSYGGNYESEILAIQEEINRLNKLKAENTVYTHDDYDFQHQYQTKPDYSHLFNEKTVIATRRCPSYPDGCSMCTRDTCLNDL